MASKARDPNIRARALEQFLQLCADGNLRVVNPTTAAQYFHLLRDQAHSLSTDPRPLVVMSPKSLLRLPEAAASLEELSRAVFRPLIPDDLASEDVTAVERLLLCTGKFYYDLAAARRDHPKAPATQIARVEELYPFPRARSPR